MTQFFDPLFILTDKFFTDKFLAKIFFYHSPNNVATPIEIESIDSEEIEKILEEYVVGKKFEIQYNEGHKEEVRWCSSVFTRLVAP